MFFIRKLLNCSLVSLGFVFLMVAVVGGINIAVDVMATLVGPMLVGFVCAILMFLIVFYLVWVDKKDYEQK